jgi:hypothetical protein
MLRGRYVDATSERKGMVTRTYPSMQSRMLMMESAEQMPHFTQTEELENRSC